MRFPFLKDLDISKEAENTLSRILEDAVKGSNDVSMTPIGKHNDPAKILDGWKAIYEANIDKITPELQSLEESNVSKFGPRSIAVPWEERRDSVSAYFGADNVNAHDYSTETPVANRLRPLGANTAVRFLKNSTNAGMPYLRKKGPLKEEVVNNLSDLLQRKDPCVMFTRTQESKKTRTVWGYPFADVLQEMRFYRPLLDIQKQQSWRAAIRNPESVDTAMTTLINYSLERNMELVSIDFSQYDATVREGLQTAAFQYVKQCYQHQFHSEIDVIANRMLTIGLITPDGVMSGPHGVPSGTAFTNEVDSLAQYVVASRIPLDLNHYQIQGDDGAYATDNPDILKEHFKNAGLNVNDEKSYVAKDYCIYLQNLYSKKYERDGMISGIYPTFRALGKIVYQERFNDFSDYDIEGRDFFAIRTISILENCRNHPLFEEFVKYVQKLDKYGLEPSQQGISSYVKMMTDKAGAEGIMNHQYGDDASGIKSFKTYKIISEH
jgi:hypothetical protein